MALCYTRLMVNDWINALRERNLDGAVLVALDALEPLGPLGAQLLWVTQPLFGVFGGGVGRATVTAIAEALEQPGGVEALRRLLEESE